MIIIFEGPDGAGKSTMIEAVKAIAEADGKPVSIWKAGPFPEGSTAKREYALPLTSLSISMDWLVMMDRWHVGELVYGPLLRGGSRLSMEQREWLEGYMRTLGVFMVYLTAQPDELVKRVGVRGDDLIKTEQLAAIYEAYEVLIADGHSPRCFARRFDTTRQRTDPTAAGIYAAAKMEAAIAQSENIHRNNTPYWEQHPWPS